MKHRAVSIGRDNTLSVQPEPGTSEPGTFEPGTPGSFAVLGGEI